MPVPPHTFLVHPTKLCYGRFEATPGGVTLGAFASAELPVATFQEGPLGGPLVSPSAFQAELEALLQRLPEDDRSIERASLVIPDRWLRMVFAEIPELPRKVAQRDEALRWKLRSLVPFRVDELRVRGVEVTSLRQGEGRRVMLGFGIELLLAQLEDTFRAVGIRLGQISNGSLALVQTLAAGAKRGKRRSSLLILVQEEGYSLLYFVGGEPVLYRYKGLDPGLDLEVASGLVRRELALTRSYLAEQLSDAELEGVVVAAPPAREAEWLSYLEGAVEGPLDLLGEVQLVLDLRSVPADAASTWPETAAMLGAALQEVA